MTRAFGGLRPKKTGTLRDWTPQTKLPTAPRSTIQVMASSRTPGVNPKLSAARIGATAVKMAQTAHQAVPAQAKSSQGLPRRRVRARVTASTAATPSIPSPPIAPAATRTSSPQLPRAQGCTTDRMMTEPARAVTRGRVIERPIGRRPAKRGIMRMPIPATNRPAQPWSCAQPCAWVSHGTRLAPGMASTAARGITIAKANPRPTAMTRAETMKAR